MCFLGENMSAPSGASGDANDTDGRNEDQAVAHGLYRISFYKKLKNLSEIDFAYGRSAPFDDFLPPEPILQTAIDLLNNHLELSHARLDRASRVIKNRSCY